MLESLGYGESERARRRRPDPVQHLLDPRVGRQPAGRQPRRGQAPEARGPEPGRGSGGLLVAVAEGPGLRAVPVRGRGLRARARSTSSGEFLQSDDLDGAGLLRVRGLPRRPADEARASLPGLGADLGRLQLRLLVLHRALHARARGEPRAARHRARGRGARGGRRQGGDAARPERELLRARPAEGRPDRLRRPARAGGRRSTGIERIRYTSPHPKDVRERLVAAHAELPSVCEHIHLPLQSGSSRILKAMRRTYDRDRYMKRVEMIRASVPDCAITTDIIVGFPGETEDDFRETLEVVDEVGYDSAFTFVFSARRDTEAATLAGPDPAPVKRERMERLVELVQRRALERSERFVGTTQEVLVEGPSRTDPAQAARAHAPQQDGQLRGPRAARRAGARSRSPARRRRRSPARSPSSPASPDVSRYSARRASARPRSRSSSPTLLRDAGRTRWQCRPTRSPSTKGSTCWRPSRRPSRLEHRHGVVRPDRRGVQRGPVRGARACARSTRWSQEGRTPIVVGGTGLYLRAALTELDLRPPPERDLRERLERELAEVGPGSAARPALAGRRRAPCTRTTASASCARWSWS